MSYKNCVFQDITNFERKRFYQYSYDNYKQFPEVENNNDDNLISFFTDELHIIDSLLADNKKNEIEKNDKFDDYEDNLLHSYVNNMNWNEIQPLSSSFYEPDEIPSFEKMQDVLSVTDNMSSVSSLYYFNLENALLRDIEEIEKWIAEHNNSRLQEISFELTHAVKDCITSDKSHDSLDIFCDDDILSSTKIEYESDSESYIDVSMISEKHYNTITTDYLDETKSFLIEKEDEKMIYASDNFDILSYVRALKLPSELDLFYILNNIHTFELDKSLLSFDLDPDVFANDNDEHAIQKQDQQEMESPTELVDNDSNSYNTYFGSVKLLHESEFNNDDKFNQSFNFYISQDETNDIDYSSEIKNIIHPMLMDVDNSIEQHINLLDSQIETLNEVLAEIDALISRPLTSVENVTEFLERIEDEMEICL